MSLLNLKCTTLLVLGTAALIPSLRPLVNRLDAQNDLPAIVHVDKTPQGIVYKVGSKAVGSTPTTDLLYALNRVRDERGPDVSVVILVDPHVPIEQLWNVEGTAGKAQLTNLHFFVLNRDTEKMSEIKWGRSIPISTNPPVN